MRKHYAHEFISLNDHLFSGRKESMQNDLWFGKYRIQKELKRHEDTIVYLAEHISLHSLCILKKIDKKSPLCKGLYQEAKILSSLHHASIPCVFDFIETENFTCLILQYLPGKTLLSVCQSIELSEKLILSYAILLCDILKYLHSQKQPVLHLDIKPSNLLISESELYLIDFGNAIRKSDIRKDFLGTKWFAPPEQYEQSILDERSDIYAFGMVLYYMVFGQEYTRRKGENIEENNRCSKELSAVINRCLMLKKTIRYSSIVEIKKRLLQIQQKQNKTGEGKSAAIYTVSGSQRHIGCTHFAMKLCKFLKFQYGNCLYIESNPTCAVRDMLTENGRLNSDGIYEYEGIPMLPFYEGRILSDEMLSKYKHIVYDYGVLSEENREGFLKGKHCFSVVGAKDWELTNSKQQLILLRNSKVIYLANFITTKEQAKLLRTMNLQIERLPYESYTLTGKTSETMKLLRDIL